MLEAHTSLLDVCLLNQYLELHETEENRQFWTFVRYDSGIAYYSFLYMCVRTRKKSTMYR